MECRGMIKLILLVLVVAFGMDALLYDGSYTQAAYHELSAVFQDIRANDGGGERRT
jgi:hypothetical protein